MAVVLCTGVDELLVQTRIFILQNAGHKVVGALTEHQATAACAGNQFEIAVIGQAMSSDQKRRMVRLIRQYCPAAKLLELYTASTGRVLGDADDWLLVPADAPGDLAQRVSALAGNA